MTTQREGGKEIAVEASSALILSCLLKHPTNSILFVRAFTYSRSKRNISYCLFFPYMDSPHRKQEAYTVLLDLDI